jgi:HEPN domain-containing protein
MSSRSKAFLNEGAKRLDIAKEEFLKPVEDLVSFSVCKNSQLAIENYLKGFLLTNSVEFEVNATIDELYKQCVKVDSNFKNIEMKAIACKNHKIDSRYCTEVNKLNACVDTADSIDTYLKNSKII